MKKEDDEFKAIGLQDDTKLLATTCNGDILIKIQRSDGEVYFHWIPIPNKRLNKDASR